MFKKSIIFLFLFTAMSGFCVPTEANSIIAQARAEGKIVASGVSTNRNVSMANRIALIDAQTILAKQLSTAITVAGTLAMQSLDANVGKEIIDIASNFFEEKSVVMTENKNLISEIIFQGRDSSGLYWVVVAFTREQSLKEIATVLANGNQNITAEELVNISTKTPIENANNLSVKTQNLEGGLKENNNSSDILFTDPLSAQRSAALLAMNSMDAALKSLNN